MLASEINRVVDESSRKLLQGASPSVRYWILTDIIEKDREDHVVQRTLKECERCPTRQKLFRTIQEDGTWPVPNSRRAQNRPESGRSMDQTQITMYNNLLRLLHSVVGSDDERINRTLDKVLERYDQEGFIRGPMQHCLPQPHYNGYALYILYGFDRQNDARVKGVTEWLMASQRKDGGWNMPYLQDVKYLPEYSGMKMDDFIRLAERSNGNGYDPNEFQDIPSCHWTTMMVLWGLMERPPLRKSKCLQKGADFLLSRFFKKNPHPNFYQSQKNWTSVKYPAYRCSGLAALWVLTKIGKGPEDPRMEKPIRWLISKRYRDGLWIESNRPHSETEQWLTLEALEILHRHAKKL
ncbi:MAG: hypothetical protein KKE24_01190 [Candidatus Thermoplasmatota archaeon]|nr:hypothetical protein [Candidatus Thermoplasmatota archaeon]